MSHFEAIGLSDLKYKAIFSITSEEHLNIHYEYRSILKW